MPKTVPFIIKALMKLGIEGMCFNLLKDIYDKPIANIVLHGEKLKQIQRIQDGD
jgi:hypothetical protein